MGGGEDARRRCQCQKALTPPVESTPAHTTQHKTRARTHAGQAHTQREHTQGPRGGLCLWDLVVRREKCRGGGVFRLLLIGKRRKTRERQGYAHPKGG